MKLATEVETLEEAGILVSKLVEGLSKLDQKDSFIVLLNAASVYASMSEVITTMLLNKDKIKGEETPTMH